MRGKGADLCKLEEADGIIPAGAGKSSAFARAAWRAEDHPRGCGEKSGSGLGGSPWGGSSPRVRGKGDRGIRRCWSVGIIPAGAGKRGHLAAQKALGGDYPRGCGEKRYSSISPSARSGSSPRVRGKASTPSAATERPRIIPAGAGKSPPSRSRRSGCRDHPRGCGEKSSIFRSSYSTLGSSPRVRGKARLAEAGVPEDGIIPAGAGKRYTYRKVSKNGPDHPRGCGEKRRARVAVCGCGGSSPRVRGKENTQMDGGVEDGIIPAGAGKSRRRHRRPTRHRDHPRGCGEKAAGFGDGGGGGGSSPRVRGKASNPPLTWHAIGIIPAGAGKSEGRGSP